MKLTKKTRKFVLCCRKDDIDESRPCSPVEIEQRNPKKPSLWSRIRNSLRERVSSRIHIRIRLRKPWKRSCKDAHDFQASHSSGSGAAAPSFFVIREKLEEKNDVNLARSSSKTKSKKKDVSSANDAQQTSNRTGFTESIKPENRRRPKTKQIKPSDLSDTEKLSDSTTLQNERVNKPMKKISNKTKIEPLPEKQNESFEDDVQKSLSKTFNNTTKACNEDMNTGSLNVDKTKLQKSSRRKAIMNEDCAELSLMNEDEKEAKQVSEYKTGYKKKKTVKKHEDQANESFETTKKDQNTIVCKRDKHMDSLNNIDKTELKESSRKKEGINDGCLELTSGNDGEKEIKHLPEYKTGYKRKKKVDAPDKGFEDNTKKSYEIMNKDESAITCRSDKYKGSLNNVDKTEELHKSSMKKEIVNKKCVKLTPSNGGHEENKPASENKTDYKKENTVEPSNKEFEDQTKKSSGSMKEDEHTIACKRDKYIGSLKNVDKTEELQKSSMKKEIVNKECVKLTPSNGGHEENKPASENKTDYKKKNTVEPPNNEFEDQTKKSYGSMKEDESTIACKRDKFIGSLKNVDKTEELQKSSMKKEIVNKECVKLTPSNENKPASENKTDSKKENTVEPSYKEFEDQTKKSYGSMKDESNIACKRDKFIGGNNEDKTGELQKSSMKKEIVKVECVELTPSNDGHEENKPASEYKTDYKKENTVEPSNKEFEDQTKKSYGSMKEDESTIACKKDKFIGSLYNVEKIGELQKSSRKETIINEECFELYSSYDGGKEIKHALDFKTNKKEPIVAMKKIHPAVSKRENKLKSASNFDLEKKITEAPVYQPSRPKTNKEKESTNDIRKKILQKIYKEVNIASKVPVATEQQWPHMESDPGGNTLIEYETTDDEMDIYDDPKPTKNNTVIIPKPKGKSENPVANVRDTTKVKDFTNQNRPMDSKYDQCTYSPSEFLNEYTTEDFITDVDVCLANLQPKSAPPKPRDTTLAPNPFPVNKNNLPQVCPPKRERPAYRKKKIMYNPLLAGVDDDTAFKRISAPAQLGKLKEVRNRLEPTPEIFLQTGKKETNFDDVIKNMSFPTFPATPLGKLQPKGRDSSMVDVKFFTQYQAAGLEDTRILQRKQMKSSKHQQLSNLDNLTQSQKNKYSKLQCTFRARDDRLPDAKFWTDLAKGKLPPEHKSQKAENEDQVMKASRCYFNEPPLGVDNELRGRHHSKRDENLEFFLTISRNPCTFYEEPAGPYDEPEPSNVPPGYKRQKYDADDPYN